jgi:hypothetical protein
MSPNWGANPAVSLIVGAMYSAYSRCSELIPHGIPVRPPCRPAPDPVIVLDPSTSHLKTARIGADQRGRFFRRVTHGLRAREFAAAGQLS